MEYYSALTKKEVSQDTTTRMNLEDIMPSEISQSQKDRHCAIPLIQGLQSRRIRRDREQNVGAKGWARGRTGVVQW